MNWRYFVGKSLSNLGNSVLCSKLMPLTRIVPQGISYPYDIKRFFQPYQIKTIFDVGANIGQTSLFLNSHFPQAEIFAFEPVQSTYKSLKNNTDNLKNVKTFNCALGKQERQKTIRLRKNSELNTLVTDNNKLHLESGEIQTVEVTTVDTFCQNNNIARIDILKMDVQGYEAEVLSGAESCFKNNLVKFIYSEIGFDESEKECQSFSEINTFLQNYDFRFSGFYEVFRWGENKKYFGFCNALFVHCNL